MKRSLLFFLITIPVLLIGQDSLSKKLEELMNGYNSVDRFNGSVLVARGGKILLNKGYGFRDISVAAKNDPNSIFRIYSITKTFTSTVILMLVEEHKLLLSDKLSKFYPDFPKGDSITVEQLLTHTSGVYDYTNGNDMKQESEPEMIRFLKTKPLDFSPGTDWRYSNSGYWLLGFIIEKITGMTYEQAVAQMIFIPLKMTHSGFDFKHLQNTNKTIGYEKMSKGISKTGIEYDPPGPYAAGAIYSTTGDMLLYHNAQQHYALVSEVLMKKAYTPFKNNYGYGWIISKFDGHETVGHSGGAAGFRTNFIRVIKDDIVIILFCNVESNNPEPISKNILNVLYTKPYKVPHEVSVNSDILEGYVGYFRAEKMNMNFEVRAENGRLVAQAANQPPTILMAQSDTSFFSEEADGVLEFVSKKGVADSVVVKQRGMGITAVRYQPGWGLIGSATAKGWDDKTPDIKFMEDSTRKGFLSIQNISLKSGDFKIRFNNDWNNNYGDNENDGILEMNGKDIKIVEGIYQLELDMGNKEKPVLTIRKI